MKRLGIALAATIGVAGLAQAADLPTAKPRGSASAGELLFEPLDLFEFKPRGVPPELRGLHGLCDDRRRPRLLVQRRAWSPTYSNGVYSFVGKQSYGSKWLWTPNGISQSVVGINMREPIPWFPGWSLVGALETGFDPLFRRTGQRSALARAE